MANKQYVADLKIKHCLANDDRASAIEFAKDVYLSFLVERRGKLVDTIDTDDCEPICKEETKWAVSYADFLNQMNQFSLAERLSRCAVSLLEREVGLNDLQTALAVNSLAVARKGLKYLDDETRLLHHRFLEILMQLKDSDNTALIAEANESLGDYYYCCELWSDSKPYFEIAKSLYSSVVGFHSPEAVERNSSKVESVIQKLQNDGGGLATVVDAALMKEGGGGEGKALEGAVAVEGGGEEEENRGEVEGEVVVYKKEGGRSR